MRTTKKQIKKPTNLRYVRRTLCGVFMLFFLLYAPMVTAQELRVIDNKGTIRTVKNNNVTSAATAPTSPVEGDVWFDTTNKITKIYDGSAWQETKAVSALSLWDKDDNTGVQVEESADENKIRFDTDGNERMIIDNLGNVGMGTNAPDTKLHVNEPLEHDSAYNYEDQALLITHTATPSSNTKLNDPKPVLYMAREGTNSETYGNKARFSLSRYENNGTNSRSRLDIDLAHGRFDDVNVMTMRSDGKVGIGEDNPTDKLHVSGDARITGALKDSNNEAGTSGQILSSTATGTDWINPAAAYLGATTHISGPATLEDANSTTKVHIEPTGSLTIDGSVLSDGFSTLVINHSTASSTVSFSGFQAAYELNEFKSEITLNGNFDLAYLESAIVTVTESGTDKYLNISRFDGGIDSVIEDADGDTKIQAEEGPDEDKIRFDTGGTERMIVDDSGNVGIGNSAPNANAILDLTNSDSKALLLPSETLPTNISSPTDGMLVYSTNNNNAYLRADSAWKPIAYNAVSNEQIFDGDDDTDTSNDDYYYVSMVINGSWKVIRYNKTDVNDEAEATVSNNSGQTTQPTDLATCTGLTFS